MLEASRTVSVEGVCGEVGYQAKTVKIPSNNLVVLAHVKLDLKSFHRLSTRDVTHVRKCTRPSPAFPSCKRRKAGRGLGTRLVHSTAVHCVGRHFQILYACAYANHSHYSGNETIVLTQKSRALIVYLYAWLARSIPVVVGKVYGHHIGKKLYSIAYL